MSPLPRNKPQSDAIEKIVQREIASAVKELKAYVDKQVASANAFRAQRNIANPKSGIEAATKDTAGAGTFLPLSGGTMSGQLNTAALKVGGNVGFYGSGPISKQTVTGSKGGNAALASLMSALSALGLVTDSTT